ncbi:uncharacterized protein FTOL_02113 [Fusarium torulosum]|uniref:Uncharacterized protein n=1 Tax=Fusarium torulosum TaxID=33205 RepID=A0AAE8M1C5_9HYPO|nr:uncharacterized protein FTOL_02113 [Fusarium torulosum]
MDSMSRSEASTPLTPSSTSGERQGMIDPRWKRPLVVLFQQRDHPELDTHGAASLIEEFKIAIQDLTVRIQEMEERLQRIENTNCSCTPETSQDQIDKWN